MHRKGIVDSNLLWVAGLILLGALFYPARADARFRFLILPFDMHSIQDISNIRRNVMDNLAGGFAKEGAEVVGMESVKAFMLARKIKNFNEELAIEIGHEVKADFALLGSITRLGAAISIDWRVFDIAKKRNLTFFFKKGDYMEGAIEDLEDYVSNAYRATLAAAGRRPVKKKGNIYEIAIAGNRRFDKEAILKELQSKAGEPFSMEKVREDIKTIYSMGYFEDVRSEFIDTVFGKKLTFIVSERPFIRKIEIEGNNKLSKEKVQGIVTLATNTILDRALVKENTEKIKALYEMEGYYLATVKSRIDMGANGAIVRFVIKEGTPVRVRRITLIGNEHFSDWRIKRKMKTRELGLLSFIDSSGKFNKYLFRRDLESIKDFYYNRGYLEAEVIDHRVLLGTMRKWFYITVNIKEGKQYRVGRIDFVGDLIVDRSELMDRLKIESGEIFNKQVVAKDIESLSDLYGDKGFANVEVNPKTNMDAEKRIADITFDIKKGPPVTIDRIDISDNDRTRDKVIRRELEVEEGQLYSRSGLRKSRGNLRRLGYFEDVTITERPGSSEDKISLDVQVKERPTGKISAGFGYSSVDKVLGTASISEDNLAGTGIRLEMSGTFSATSEKYDIGFTNPWIFDKPVSAGFDLYKDTRNFPDFTRDSKGFDIHSGWRIYGRHTTASLLFKNEVVDVADIADSAAIIIKDQAGKRLTRSIRASVKRDTRNDAFFPTEGSIASVSVEYAGGPLKGDNDFVKTSARVVKYFPLPKETTIMLSGRVGSISAFNGHQVPIYERFFLGGINSIRGFRDREVGPRDAATNDFIGGAKEMLFNTEFIFPFGSSQIIRGLVFFDAGNAYDTSFDFGDIRTSTGLGVRWLSPIGPLRLEWGYNLDRREDEKASQFDFNIGGRF